MNKRTLDSALVHAPKRIENKFDDSLGVLKYGKDNLFPNHVRNMSEASPTCDACINVMSDYVNGQGFGTYTVTGEAVQGAQISEINNFVLNRYGETVGDILSKSVRDLIRYGGYYLHINYNALLEPVELQFVPFENCRRSKPDNYGYSTKIKVCQDWTKFGGMSWYGLQDDETPAIHTLDIFNNSKEFIQAQIDAAGGFDKYKGQIYFFNPSAEYYPRPLWDGARLDVATEARAASFRYNNIARGFQGAYMGGYHGNITDADKRKLTQQIKDFQGDDAAQSILMLWTKGALQEGKDSPFWFKPIAQNNNDKMFEYTERVSEDKIIRAFDGMPPALVGVDRGTSGLNGVSGDAYRFAQKVFNARTQNKRVKVAASFTELLRLFPSANVTEQLQIIPVQLVE